ncbi:MAG: MIP family channel protein [Chitinophagaceae bacterium]|nr:MIP family channel protein [Chitinophagaceae bacterium]
MKKYFSELVGTMCLVLFGCGAAVISGGNAAGLSGLGLLGISFAFGLAVVAMAYTIGGISGCHINPAITIAMLVAGKINAKDAAGYIIAQMIGAVAGAGILFVIASGQDGYKMGEWALGSNGWGVGYLGAYSVTAAFITEAVFTFVFLYVILNVTSKHGNSQMAGLTIGITLVLIHLVAIPITGTSVNPARSFGPALFAQGKALSQLWLFFAAPVAGAVAAALVWKITGEDK